VVGVLMTREIGENDEDWAYYCAST